MIPTVDPGCLLAGQQVVSDSQEPINPRTRKSLGVQPRRRSPAGIFFASPNVTQFHEKARRCQGQRGGFARSSRQPPEWVWWTTTVANHHNLAHPGIRLLITCSNSTGNLPRPLGALAGVTPAQNAGTRPADDGSAAPRSVGNGRVTIWEIHPITRIEVLKDGSWADLDPLP